MLKILCLCFFLRTQCNVLILHSNKIRLSLPLIHTYGKAKFLRCMKTILLCLKNWTSMIKKIKSYIILIVGVHVF